MTAARTDECRIPAPDGLARPVTPRALTAAYQPDFGEQSRVYKDWVMSLDTLDLVTSEIVRLRCARTHACRVCQSLRWAGARAEGFDGATEDKIDRYEESDLATRHKVALRLVDAYVTRPGDITPELAAEVRATFTPTEIVEMLLDLSKWSGQKVHVALRIDGADPSRLLFDVDTDGVLHYVEAD